MTNHDMLSKSSENCFWLRWTFWPHEKKSAIVASRQSFAGVTI